MTFLVVEESPGYREVRLVGDVDATDLTALSDGEAVCQLVDLSAMRRLHIRESEWQVRESPARTGSLLIAFVASGTGANATAQQITRYLGSGYRSRVCMVRAEALFWLQHPDSE